jgi:tetratricopeptide (TPR) repeat protein
VRASREEIDRRTDVYSLGATLYEILTGQPAFSGNTTQEILQGILDREPRSPRKVRPGLPWELEVITLKAMEKNVNRRYQTALAMADDIDRFLNGETILARPSGVFYRSWKRMRKHKEITVLVMAVLALAIVVPVQMVRGRATSRESKFEMSLANAQSLLKQGNDADALREFSQALELKPNDLDAIEGQSLALYHQASQKEQFAERAAKDSTQRKAAMEEATRLFRESFAKLKVAASRDSKNGAVYLALGEVISRLGNSENVIESLTDIEKAGAMSRESFDVQLGVAKYYMNFVLSFSPPEDQQVQLLDRAYQHANAAVQLKRGREDEELASALLIRAEIAIERCQRAMASGGASTFTRYYELAKEDVRRASLINPKDYLARKLDEMLKDVGEKSHKTLGKDWRVTLAELGLSSDFARSQWDNTAELRSSASKVLSSFLGQERSTQGPEQRQDADELARQARQLDQEDKKDQALDMYAAAFAMNPEMADLAWRGAQLALELRDYKRARALILAARRIAPVNPLYMQTDVEIAMATQDHKHAGEVVEQLLMLYPDTSLYYQRLLSQPAAPDSDQH